MVVGAEIHTYRRRSDTTDSYTWVSHGGNAYRKRAYLVLEPSVIRVMPIVNLALVVYNSE